jgi:hypothetical protein
MKQPTRVVVSVYRGKRPSRDDYAEDTFRNEVWDLLVACWQQTPETRPSMIEVIEKLELIRGTI